MMWKAFIAAGALSVASALPAAAATLSINSDGILIGASGVSVATSAGTKTYNVEFLNGSCPTLFTNCGASDAAARPFAFSTAVDANAASQSLFDQVFVDVSAGAFNSQPGLTAGCINDSNCIVFTPYGITGASLLVSVIFNNDDDTNTDAGPDFGLVALGSNTANESFSTFARWTEVAAIPLPAGAPLVLTGLAALAGLRWRKRRQNRRAEF